MTVSEYSKIKEDIIIEITSNNRHREILSSLKESFRDSINSERRLEQIKTIGDLLSILELRDVLSEENVSPLRKIVRELSNKEDLLQRITEYEDMHVPTELRNYYAPQHGISSKKEAPAEGYLNTNPLSDTMSERKKKRIFQTITDEIGSYWRDLGRNLMIRECDIDQINCQYDKVNIKAIKLMERFEGRADPQRWFFVLCDALEKSRRRDLVKSIQDIMAMNI